MNMIKDGVEYFPMSVDFFEDRNVKLLQARCGIRGIVVLLKLYAQIYKNAGYYVEFGEEDCLLLAQEISTDVTGEDVQNVIDICLEYHLLTSKGIQKRFLHAVSRRDYVLLRKEYWLLDPANRLEMPASSLKKVDFMVKNADGVTVICNDFSENVYVDAQRKEKDRKENHRKGEHRTERSAEPSSDGTPAPNTLFFQIPSEDDVEAYCKQQRISIPARHFINYYAARGWMMGKLPMRDWRAALQSWVTSQPPRIPGEHTGRTYTEEDFPDDFYVDFSKPEE